MPEIPLPLNTWDAIRLLLNPIVKDHLKQLGIDAGLAMGRRVSGAEFARNLITTAHGRALFRLLHAFGPELIVKTFVNTCQSEGKQIPVAPLRAWVEDFLAGAPVPV